jgi:hypothetical protein
MANGWMAVAQLLKDLVLKTGEKNHRDRVHMEV